MDMFIEKPTYEQLEAENAQLRALVAQMTARDIPVPQRRFAEFWQVYPNKKGRQAAEKKWQALQLDKMADQIITHVRWMMAKDDGWQRGYAPMGSTYVNEGRWTDVAQGPARAAQPQYAPSKAMQTIIGLEASKRERLDANGNRDGVPAANLPWTRAPASNGSDGWNGHGLGNGSVAQPGMGSGGGRAAIQGRILDHDGD